MVNKMNPNGRSIIPDVPIITPRELPKTVDISHKLASGYVKRKEKSIDEYKEELADGEDIRVYVILNDGNKILAQSFGYYNPNMIRVYGLYSDGTNSHALLHQNSIQILLTKVQIDSGDERQEIEFNYHQ